MVKIVLSECQNLTLNLDFRGRILTFRAENKAKKRRFKPGNNASTTSEHLQNNFEKVQKTTFLPLKMVKRIRSQGQNLAYN